MVDRQQQQSPTGDAAGISTATDPEEVVPRTSSTADDEKRKKKKEKKKLKKKKSEKKKEKKTEKSRAIDDKPEKQQQQSDDGVHVDEQNADDDVVDVPNDADDEKKAIAATATTTTDTDKPNFYSTDADCDTFDKLPLNDRTLAALATLKYERMTQIQARAIPIALTGKDVIGSAKTGSGKTLAFVLPCLEFLTRQQFKPRQGCGVLVLTPTRELAMQIYAVIQEVSRAAQHSQTYGLIMGGANRRTEVDKLTKGVNMIVATPGRLLDHLQNTPGFIIRNLLAFVVDEADRILEQGFEDDLRQIIKLLPTERQTMLYSATQTKKVEDLIRLSVKPSNSVFIEIPNATTDATVVGLEQGYVTVPSDQRFLLLFTFLKKNMGKKNGSSKKKIIVFFSSCHSVKYHCELLNYIDIPCVDLHGKQKQMKRTTTFFQFCQQESGILLATDVAARGLDIPNVDWIIQYDPPDDPSEYIHRVGRTARGASGKGRALLFLTPEETGFLQYLRAAKIQSIQEYEFPLNKIANIQSQLYKLIDTNYYLNRSARDAFRSYVLAYASHTHKHIFNVHALDLQAVGQAFGFMNPPRIDSIMSTLSNKNKLDKKRKYGGMGSGGGGGKNNKSARQSGHAFSADNPYGVRAHNDKRQFSH